MPFSIKASNADLTNQVISFNRSSSTYSEDTTNKVFTSKSKTPSGNDVYLICDGGINPANTAIAAVPSTYESSYKDPVLKFYLDSTKINNFRHQTIESVSITTSASITMSVQVSADGITFVEKGTLNCSSTAATMTGFDSFDRYVLITCSSRAASTRNIRDVTIRYSCSKDVFPSFTIGPYIANIKNSANVYVDVDIEFNSDGKGYYHYTNSNDSITYITNFTWEYSDITDNITIKFASGGTGNNAAYQGCRLFSNNSSTATDGSNMNYMAVVNNKLSFFFYTTNSKTAKWTSPTIFDQQ